MFASPEDQLFVFALSIGFLATTYEIARYALGILTKRKGFALDERSIDTLVTHGPSYANSLIHAIINGYQGVVNLVSLANAPTSSKLFGFDPIPHGEFVNATRSVLTFNTFFRAHLLLDLFHVLRKYPKLGGMDVVLHHSVFLTCSIINHYYFILPFGFTWLIIGEISTIFMNLRWFLIKTGRGDMKLCRVVENLFALTFFVTRIVIYSMGVFDLATQKSELIDAVKRERVPLIFLGVSVFFICVGFILNFFWFQKILYIAIYGSKKKKSE